jgi:hypothetical protein
MDEGTSPQSVAAHQPTVSSDLWAYRERLVAAFRRKSPSEAKSKEEELGRLSEEDREVLKSLGYIE